jgi:hypothetical protein
MGTVMQAKGDSPFSIPTDGLRHPMGIAFPLASGANCRRPYK